MKTFNYKNNKYLTLKNHTFFIISGFNVNYNKVFYQVTTTSKGGIIPEYLPKDWKMQKAKYNGQMIYNLYNKKYFKYDSQAEKKGYLTFIAPTIEGAYYLLAKLYLFPEFNIAINATNLKITLNYLKNEFNDRYGIIRKAENLCDNKLLQAIYINTNDDWHMSRLQKEIINELKETKDANGN